MLRLRNESGQALLLVMMVVMVLVLIGAAALTRTSGSRMRSFEQKKMVQSSYIAEAGVEKALANIKNDPYWLKGLAYNTVVNYITSLAYAGGQITSVKVTRTSNAGVYPTTFSLESQGDYQGATRTIKVNGEMYEPVDFAKGVWVGSNACFTTNTEYNCNVTGAGDMVFKNNINAMGDILAKGNILLENNMTATSIVSGGSLSLAQNVLVTSNVRAGVDISLENNANISGTASAVHNITLGSKSHITGDVYYNNNLNMGSEATTGTPHPGGATPVVVSLPPFPQLDESVYSQHPDRVLSDTLTGNFNVDGISYAPGDLYLTGTYTGNGIIVTHGKVTITGNLKRPSGDNQSSLAIISFGNIDGVGIEVCNNFEVYALLYSPNSVNLNNNTNFFGSIVCKGVLVDQNTKVSYDSGLQVNHPIWTTTVVKIKSWKEAYSVF